MRDDAVECGVCHRPRVVVSTEGFAVIDDSRVGAGRSTGMPVAIVVMLFLVLAAGVGLLAWSRVTAPWMLYACWALMGASMAALRQSTPAASSRFREAVTDSTTVAG